MEKCVTGPVLKSGQCTGEFRFLSGDALFKGDGARAREFTWVNDRAGDDGATQKKALPGRNMMVVITVWPNLFPFRTEKLNALVPMVLP